MTRAEVEAEIRRLIATETSAVRFSNKLFTPGGLFSRLYTTPAEKLALVDSPLFDEANRRLSELQMLEAGGTDEPVSPTVMAAVGPAQLEHIGPTPAKP